MGIYLLETVVQKWEQGNLTPEQAIGQILLHLQAVNGRINNLERREQRPLVNQSEKESTDKSEK
ncbi:MAG: hypothetical protein KDE48_12595 [Anaerolineales bacterium]|nr:hypothetical protein [Anaerolineales bacterium]